MNPRVREFQQLLDGTADPRERDRIETAIATIGEDLDDPQPTDQELDEWAPVGEDRMLRQMGWD